jgi:hypothetical protein
LLILTQGGDSEEIDFIERLLEDPTDFDEGDLAPPSILFGPAWFFVRLRLLSAVGLRSASVALMGTPIDTEEVFTRPVGKAPKNCSWNNVSGEWVKDDDSDNGTVLAQVFYRPVGAPKKNQVWNESTGQWDKLHADEDAAHGFGSIKRPRGPPPAGKQWDHEKGCWISIHVLIETDGSVLMKRPRGPTPIGKVWDPSTGRWAEIGTASSTANIEMATAADKERMGRSNGGAGKFRRQWSDAFPFLTVVKISDDSCASAAGESCPGCALCSAMKCTDCVIKQVKNVFGSESSGCTNFRKTAVARHCCDYHPALGQLTISESFSRSIADHRERILKIFLTVLWLAANRLPMRKIRSAAALLRLSGVHLGRSYVNKDMARDMLCSLSHVVRERYVVLPAQESPALGLMIDESMDVSKSENMVLYLRFLFMGIFVTRFWRIIKCRDVTAAGLTATIRTAFEEDNIDTRRLFSLGTDGASVMTGCNGGVAVLLRLLCCAFLLACHCIAHRQALSAAAAAEGNATMDFAEGIMHPLLNYHTRSALRSDHLEEIQVALQVAKRRLIKWVTTRWLSRGATAQTIAINLVPLAVELERDKAACITAESLYAAVTSHKFVFTITVFADLLGSLNQLNTSFQVTHPMYGTVIRNVDAFLDLVTASYLGRVLVGGTLLAKLRTAMARGSPGNPALYFVPATERAQASEVREPADRSGGIVLNPVRRILADEDEVIGGVKEFCTELVLDLKRRFKDDAFNEVIHALSICFDFRLLDLNGEGKLIDAAHGDSEIAVLIRHFGFTRVQTRGVTSNRMIHPDDALIEWQTFKHILVNFRLKKLSLDEAFQPTFNDSSQFINMRFLLAVFMCLCLSTVCCEAGFSLMASIMTAIRNCMNIMTLDYCMQIASNCPSFDYLDTSHDEDINSIVESAFSHWELTMQRFPARSNGKQGRKKKDKGIPLADLFEKEAKEARRSRGFGRLLDESDDSTDDDDDDGTGSNDAELRAAGGGVSAGASERDDETDENQFLSIGDYEIPFGWEALERPAETASEWKSMQKAYKWQNKKLAHIWDAPIGWQMASFSNWEKGMCCFYYPTDRQKVLHQLDLDNYGIDGHWVILQKT